MCPISGSNRVMVYRLDTARGVREPHHPPWVPVRAGAGSRQLVMHPRGDFAYLINEMDSTRVAFRYDGKRGILREIQTVSTLPPDFGTSSCAEVQIAPSGDVL